MLLQATTALLYVHHFLAASAWSASTFGILAARSAVPTRYGGGLLLASIGTASADGECRPTTIPEGTTAGSPPSSSGSSLGRRPKSGDVVTFTLRRFRPVGSSGDDDGGGGGEDWPIVPFDTDGTRQLVLDGGNYLPGLHGLLSTMRPGETIEGAIVDAGYGARDPDLVYRISDSELGKSVDTSRVSVGTVLGMGNGVECRVTATDGETWTLDANPRYAGYAYEVDLTLDMVEEGPTNWEYYKEGDATAKNGGRYTVATFALGCFWGGELAYQRMPGVISTHVGYTQGHKIDPTYEEVCSGTTGHAEAIRIVYDEDVASYESLVRLGLDRLGEDVYRSNRVGNDRGTQYRHGIYYHDDHQRRVAEKLLNELAASGGREVMTELKEARTFYMAEEYHQQYLLKGGQSARKGSRETIRCYG
ncbi:hypothetical protein ACHAW5_000963 [Stephanodiscus triporus]|uniref:peptide-methionine (S)-S-oxide reductase n=1 Tax=Stephanodiscus triporus TaxID=2934178 RepID=A0ABD3PIA9_9STRA